MELLESKKDYVFAFCYSMRGAFTLPGGRTSFCTAHRYSISYSEAH